MFLKMLLLTVDRYEVLRFDETEHHFEFFLIGMARDMDLVHALVDHFGPQFHQLVDDTADHFLVAGDGRGGDDDVVVRCDLDFPVVGERHAGQSRHRLALAAGGDEHQLIVRIPGDLVERDDESVRHIEVAEFLADGHDVFHAPAAQGDFPPGGDRLVHDLLDSVDVGRKGGDDDTPFAGRLEQPVEAVADRGFTGGVAGFDGVGGVREVTEDPFLPQFREPGKVDHAAVHRSGVDLEVAGVDDRSDICRQREGQGIRDGVVDVDGLHIELSEFEAVPRLDLVELHAVQDAVLFQFAFDEADGERRAVDRLVDDLQKVREAADVVLVTVRDDDAFDLVFVAFHIREVRDDDVDTEHLRFRERETAVEDDHIAVVLEQGHVLADLIETAEERDSER